jgi:hypothetical protein
MTTDPTVLNKLLLPLIRKRRQFFNVPQFQVPQAHIPQVPSFSMPNAPQIPEISLPSPSGLLNGIQSDLGASFMSKIRSLLGRLLDPRFWYLVFFLALLVLFAYCCLCTPLGNMCYQCTRFSVSSFRSKFGRKNEVGVDESKKPEIDNETKGEEANEANEKANENQKSENPV